MLLPEPSRRRRASCASTRASSMTIATRASPSASAIASSTSVAEAPLADGHDPPDSILELLVRRDDVDHEVPVRLPEPDHRDRRDRVEDELLRRAGLEPGRSREELGPDDDCDLVRHETAELRLRGAHHARGEGARVRGSCERSEHVRRRTAGAHADDCVGSTDVERLDVGCACVAVVLGGCLNERVARSLLRRRVRRRLPGGVEKVASHSEASSAAMRPDVPAPT